MWDLLKFHYGNSYIMLAVIVYGGVNGIAAHMMYAAALPYFQREHQLDVYEYQRMYAAVVVAPNTFKALIGMTSDTIPLAHYNKRVYMGTALVAIVACVAIIAGHKDIPTNTAILVFGILSAAFMTVNLLMEASYIAKMNDPTKYNASGLSIIPLLWVCQEIGAIISAILVGTLTDRGYLHTSLWCAIPLTLCGGIMVWNGMLAEQPKVLTCAIFKPRADRILTSITITVAGILCIGTTRIQNPTLELCSVLSICGITLYMMRKLLTRPMATITLILYLLEATKTNVVGATAYFFTYLCENTPNFSYTFYTSYSMLLKGVFTIIGILIYTKLMKYPVRDVLMGITITQSIISSFDVAQTSRWNIDANIPDEVFYILGETILSPVTSVIGYIPILIVTSNVAEMGTEALTYGILAGSQALGMFTATAIGTFLIDIYDIHECNYDCLPYVILLGRMLLPLLIPPLLHILFPGELTVDRKWDHYPESLLER